MALTYRLIREGKRWMALTPAAEPSFWRYFGIVNENPVVHTPVMFG